MHAILLLLLTAAAPSLHKCLGDDGVASYQSLPCAAGQRTAWTRPAPRPAAPVPSAAPQVAVRPVRQAAARRTAAVHRQLDASGSRCASARRAADLTRDRLWNRLSFRQRSDLDARVARACARR